MISKHSISQRQAYKAVSLPRTSGCYKHKSKADEAVIDQLNKLVEKHEPSAFGKVIIASE
jgi:hypothetical protein